MLRTNLINSVLALTLAFSLPGCGLSQRVTGGAKAAVTTIFYKKVDVLHLDFTAREALNTDARENNTLPEPVVIRVWQLKDRKTFDRLVYQQLLNEGETLLESDLLASRDVVLKPGGAAILDMPLHDEARYVAIAGLFRHPDLDKNTWKQVLERKALNPDKARVLVAGTNTLTLLPE